MTEYPLGTCQRCGKPASTRTAKFCGPECLNTPVYRNCAALDCGKQFNAGRTRQQYCSKTCRAANQRDPRTQPICIASGCKLAVRAKDYCWKHWDRLTRYGKLEPEGVRVREHPDGTILPAGHGYLRIKVDGEWWLEHRYRMSVSLGRDLLPDENVHHKNGDRSDNRLENLELWTVSQPAGQRVQDKIDWAIQFLSEYGYQIV